MFSFCIHIPKEEQPWVKVDPLWLNKAESEHDINGKLFQSWDAA